MSNSKFATEDYSAESQQAKKAYKARPYHKYKEPGVRKYFRLLPAHPGTSMPMALHPKRGATFMLPNKYKNNEIGPKFVFSTLVHAGPEIGSCKQDPVVAYLVHGSKKIKEAFGDTKTDKTAKAFSDLMRKGTNYRDHKVKVDESKVAYAVEVDKDGNWVMIASESGEMVPNIAILEIGYSIENEMKNIALEATGYPEEAVSRALYEFFLDPKEGKAVGIMLNKDNKYSISVLSEPKTGVRKVVPLDAQIETCFDELEPLATIFRNAYKESDWDLAIEGLKAFEMAKSKDSNSMYQGRPFFNFFDDEDFLDMLEGVKENIFSVIGVEEKDSAESQAKVMPPQVSISSKMEEEPDEDEDEDEEAFRRLQEKKAKMNKQK